MKKRKILFVITKSVWGGAQRYVFDLANALPKEEFDVCVAAGGNGDLFQKLAESGIRTIPIPGLERDISIIKEIRSLFFLYKIFIREQPDVIHLNSSKIGGLGSLAGRFALVPNIIFTVHGWPFNEDRNFFSKAAIRFSCWLTALFSHTIIVLTTHDLADSQHFFLIPENKFVLIPNGIRDNASLFKTKEGVRKELGLEIAPEDALIGTIAELTKNKGLKFLVSALKRLPPSAHVAIIGDGEEKSALVVSAKNLGLEQRVHFLGFKINAAEYLPAFDIFAIPSVKEGLPYTLLEAGLAGLPVVATRVGGIPDIIEDGKTGLLVETKDPVSLAGAIKRLLENSGKASLMGKDLQARILSEFSFEKMCDATKKLYR